MLAGDGDEMVDFDRQSRRFHDEMAQSELIVTPGEGHMAHHTAPDQIVAAASKRMQERASSS